MKSLIVFILFAITQSSLSAQYIGRCRDDDDHYQTHELSDSYIRRAYLEGDGVRSKLISILPLASDARDNRNENINLNSIISHHQPANIATFSEWWEIITERTPSGGKRTYVRLDPAARINSYDTIKSHINNERGSKERFIRREELYEGTRKNAPAPQAASRRSKGLTLPEKLQIPTKNIRQNEGDPDVPNSIRRKTHDNVNSNTNINQNARRSSTPGDLRRSNTNSNKNINVNENSALDDRYDMYQKLGRGVDLDGIGSPKTLRRNAPRPIAERSNSNVNTNVNTNVNSDGYNGGPASDEYRRSFPSKKRRFPHSHHPNDNQNVNININGEDTMDDPMDDQAGDSNDPDTDSMNKK